MERLAGQYRVIACDMSNSGRSGPIPQGNKYTLDEEVAFLGPIFRASGTTFHLVGHSFGGAVALKAALRYRGRVRSLILFEPTLFALLVSSSPESPAAREIVSHIESTSRRANLGHHESAAQEFVDYWFHAGAWASTREEVRADICGRMSLVEQRWDALLHDSVALSDIASIDIPILILTAKDSNAPTRALGQLLIDTLPHARCTEMQGVGHMAPLSDPDRVNSLIEAFLQEVAFSPGPPVSKT
jgi:pimeloyl-ACP methyl ester carboxylesterase